MIPASWDPYFGYELGEAMEEFAAEQTLEFVGLSYLVDSWWLSHPDQPDQKVVLVEATPEHLV